MSPVARFFVFAVVTCNIQGKRDRPQRRSPIARAKNCFSVSFAVCAAGPKLYLREQHHNRAIPVSFHGVTLAKRALCTKGRGSAKQKRNQ